MSGRGSELWLWSGAGCLGALELPAFAAAGQSAGHEGRKGKKSFGTEFVSQSPCLGSRTAGEEGGLAHAPHPDRPFVSLAPKPAVLPSALSRSPCAFTPDAEALEEEDGGGRVEEEEEEPFPSATLPPLFFTNDDNLGISLSLSVHRSGRQESTSGALRFARGSETHTIQPSEVPQAVTPPATSRDCHKQARPPTNTRKRRNDQTPSPSSTKTFLSGADEPDTKN
mmetsp:Transcript_18419/g.38280  ORF Transcript_18419/g.38280 Transcript_18419/m.38280 type:complete len:225 (-) Transcript_18419:89-763(-)